jgi:hypothetical protein
VGKTCSACLKPCAKEDLSPEYWHLDQRRHVAHEPAPFETPRPFQPVAGWVAISLRSLRMGDLFHDTYSSGAFAWLSQTQPVARIGKTILLYYIPPRNRRDNNRSALV